MKLEATVEIRRTPEEVWAYLSDVSNVSKWDRGVAETRSASNTAPGVGFEFDTLGYPRKGERRQERGKMSYRISEADPAFPYVLMAPIFFLTRGAIRSDLENLKRVLDWTEMPG
jgi:hypothetical protein